MNVRPLFAGLGVAAGGAAAIFYLQLREIVDQSWGWYPAEEVHTLTWVTGASLLICLLALLIATWPEKNPERVDPPEGRTMKLTGDSMRGFGIGLVVAGAGAFFFPYCTGAISMILGVCAVVLGYRALDAEREMEVK